MLKLCRILLSLALSSATIAAAQATPEASHRVFIFGQSAKPSNAVTAIASAAPYSPGWGFGFEGDLPSVESSSIGGAPFFFSFDAPEGNYRLTLTLGADEPSDTTVKAELRRLMIEAAAVPAGGSLAKTFIV